MWQVVAAEAPVQDSNVTLILGIVGSVSLVLVAVVGGVFSLLTAKQNRTSASPVSTAPVDFEAVMTRLARHGERIAVLEHRAEDNDETNEIQDRRLDRHDELLDDDSNPRWRHLHDRD